jgi:PAP2 superfamily protein
LSSQDGQTAGWVLLGLVAPAVDAARGSPGWLALVHPIQATSLFASMVFLLVSGPRLRELLLFLAGAVGIAIGHRAWLHLFSFRGVPFEQTALAAAGLASLVALAARAAASERGSEQRALLHLAVMLPAFGMAMGLALDLTIPLHGRTWDPIVLGLDAGFGQPSFVVGRVAAEHPAVLTLLSFVYLFLPVMMAAMLVLEKRRAVERQRGLLRAILLAAVVGYALYHVYPVVGPGPLFGARFPYGPAVLPGPPRRLIEVAAIEDPRNCVPSLHVGWALLIYWHARALGTPARAAGAIWLVSTIVATLAMGQHYFVDLVVAVPFAALIDALAARGAPRRTLSARGQLIATAVLLLVIWYAILFLAPPGASGGLPLRLLAVATIAGSWAVHARWSAQR